MEGFQILRCLQKYLDKTLQSIIAKFSKIENITQKYSVKFPKITLPDFNHDFAPSKGKICLCLFYINLFLRIKKISAYFDKKITA